MPLSVRDAAQRWRAARGASKQSDFVVFYASDVHGSDRCWFKFVNAAKAYGADALIMGGDLAGKAVVPIVRQGAGKYRMVFLGDSSVFSDAELDEAKKRVAFNGFYAHVCDSDEVKQLEQSPDALNDLFRRLIIQRLERWLHVAEERLADSGTLCYVMPGNDDDFYVDDVLANSSFVINPDMRVVPCGPFEMLSCSWVPPTPWESPRECEEEELTAKLNGLANELDPDLPTIANLHSPPFGTGLDEAPEINADLTLTSAAVQGKMVPVGSHAVRSLIEEVQPVVALHGHIHECRGTAKIGETVCVNPGSSYGEGVLDGCIVNFRESRLRGTQLIRG
jgi:Icc-related predicted phosphoesterase